MTVTHSSELLTEQEAANYLSVVPRTLRLWRRVRNLPYIKLSGKVIRYRRDDLDRWISKHAVSTPTV